MGMGEKIALAADEIAATLGDGARPGPGGPADQAGGERGEAAVRCLAAGATYLVGLVIGVNVS